MALPTVNAVTCQIVNMHGPTSKRQRVESWFVPGLTGIGAQKLGRNDGEWSCEIVFFGIKADCDTFAIAMDAVQGSVITIVDSKADSYTGLLVENVSAREIVRAYHAKSIAAVALGTTGWRCSLTMKGKYV